MKKENLKEMAAALLPAAVGEEEQKFLQEVSTEPKPEHREGLIKIRDQALDQGAMVWAVELTHAIAAMTEPEFWVEETSDG